jgi:AcrR family transcriptional regulator
MPKTVDHDQRRSQLAAALWRIVDRGALEPIGIRDVAAEAGVSVGMVQHYFPDKASLLRFAVERLREKGAARVQRKLRALPEPRDPLEVVKVIMRERLPLTPRQAAQGRVVLAWLTQIGYSPELAGVVASDQRQICAVMADCLRAGQADGRVHEAIDAETAAFGLWALNEGLVAGLLTGLHTPRSALQVLDEHFKLLATPARARGARR